MKSKFKRQTVSAITEKSLLTGMGYVQTKDKSKGYNYAKV